jgi:hypothetical protein
VDLDSADSQDLAVDSLDLDSDVHHMDMDKNQAATNQLKLQAQSQLQHALLVRHLPSLAFAEKQHAQLVKHATLPHLHAQLVQPQLLHALLLHPKQHLIAHAELQLAPLDKFVTQPLTHVLLQLQLQ